MCKTSEMDVCLAIEKMKQKAAKDAAEKERISILLKSIEKLMEKAGWSAEHSMDVLDVSGRDRKKLGCLLNKIKFPISR